MAKRRRTLGAPRNKKLPLPIANKTIARLRWGANGELTNQRGIVMGMTKENDFTRAYGREVYVCVFDRGKAEIEEKSRTMLYPVGVAKRIPRACRLALQAHKRS